MKKLLLLFAVMLSTVGTWAQVNYGKRTWTFPATSHEAVAEVPAEIFADFKEYYKVETKDPETGEVTSTTYTELTNEKVGVFVTDVRVATVGDVTATFVYNDGNIRMDISGVDLVNANGEVVYSDYHFGYSGGNKVDNVYTLTGVAVGDYTMRAFIPAQKEDLTSAANDSKGVLTITGAWMYPNEGVYYNIKNVRSNKYVTFKGEGKQFTQESVKNGAGSYWHFVEASLDDVKKWNNPWLVDDAIPAGVKPYWVYSAACEKGVENVTNGYMASPDMSESYPAKIYYIGVHTSDGKTGLVFRPCHEDGSSWNDAGGNGTALGHYTSNDPGSLWSVELANVADNDLMALGTTAKNEALATANAYKNSYYIYAKPSVVDAAIAELEGADVSTVAKALAFVVEGTGTANVNEIEESATVLTPKAGDRFMIKGNVQQNDYLIAATTGNVKTTNGIGANDINALDLVWTLKATEGEGKFYLYNERLGVYVAPLTTTRNGTMGYVTEVANAGVYSVELKGTNVAFHADTQDDHGYIHHPRWQNKELTRWNANDASSQWQLVEAPLELTTDIDAPICYAIKSARDGNYYFTLENNKIKLVNNQNIVGNDNAKWFFMLDVNKNLKIYPYADKNNTMGYITVSDDNTKLTNDHAATGFVADTYTLYYNPNLAAKNNGKCFAFRPTEGNTFVSNHGGTGNYMGFYNENDDKGTRLGFESINEAVLANKIATWDSYLANEGDKVCQYVIADGVKTAVTNAIAVSEQKPSGATAINAALTALNAFEFPSINQPTVGKFYRLKNHQSGWYATSTLRTGEAQHSDKLYMKEAGNTVESVWYLAEGNKLVSFKEGRYLGDMSSDWSFEAVGADGNAVVFNESAVIGRYQILPSSGRALYGDQVRVDAAGDTNNSGNYAWKLEEVTWLPIPVNVDAGYTTLYSPVELALSFNRFKAYTVSKVNAGYATLEEQTVVPAGVGVVLELQDGAQVEDGCVFLQVNANGATKATSALRGTYADEYIASDAYVLSMVDGEVGLYKAKLNQQENTAFLNNGFKAYLPASVFTAGARFLVFDFGGTETAIEGIEGENGNVKTEIYDLAGRRVQNAQKGVFIVNGKVVIK